ncbi:MAG: putative Ig domain-containing protein [Magnetococcales bacterium]|nr:putative Ig domain-containing protein [Magnetococcales bacterium]
MRPKKPAGVVSALFLAAFASACGGRDTGQMISGTVIKGPLSGTTVSVLDASGKILVKTKSGTDARYSLIIPAGTMYPLRLSISGGNDLMTGNSPMDMDSLIVSSSQTTANVTPITSMMVQTAVNKAGSLDKVTADTVSAVKSTVISQFGFGIDAEDSTIDPVTTAVSANNMASILRASEAVAEMVRRSVGTDPTAMAQAIKVIGEDLADDMMDGKKNGAALSQSMPYGFTDPNTFLTVLEQHKVSVGAEVVNGSFKVTKTDGTQFDNTSTLLAQAINAVDSTITTSAAQAKINALPVSASEKTQLTADIANATTIQQQLGQDISLLTSLAAAVGGLSAGQNNTGKIDATLMGNVTSTVTALNQKIKGNQFPSTTLVSAISALTTNSNSSSANTQTSTPTVAKAGLSGTVAGGAAMVNAKVTMQSASGTTIDVGTTDAKGQFSGFTPPDGFDFPAVMIATGTTGTTLRTIIPINKKTNGQTANVNPITHSFTAQVLPTGKTLATLDVSNGDSGLAATAKKMVQTALGSAVDYDTFANKPFNAKTDTNPTAGGLADTLIDVVAGLDPSRRPEEILTSASDKDDPSISGNLMGTPAFQAKVAGELVAQGRSADDAKGVISSGVSPTANTATLLANTSTFVSAFSDVATAAAPMLTGTSVNKQKTLEAVVNATAKVIATTVEKSGATQGNSLNTVISNSMAVVKNPIIQIGQENQAKTGTNLVLSTTADQVANLLADNATKLAKSGADTSALGNQVKNFGEIVSSVVSNSLATGTDKQTLDNKKQQIVAQNIAKGVADSMTLYLDDMAKDPATLPDAEKASLQATLTKATNTASNTAKTLDSALTVIVSNDNSKNLDGQVLNSLAKTIVGQTSETLKNYDLTIANSTAVGSALNVVTNMATLVVGTAASMANDMASLSTGQKAALTSAMAGQVLNEVKTLDLTGATLPDSAKNISNNLAKTVGPALVENVAATSSRKGSNLEVLAMGAAAQATAKVKEEMALTEMVTGAVLETAKTKSKDAAKQTSATLEISFQAMESSGVTLGDVTKGMSDSHVNGDAVNTVVSQVKDVLVNSGSLKGAAQEIAQTASSMANAVLNKGGTLAQVKEAVAAPLAAMTDVATTTLPLNTEAGQDAIKNSINALKSTASSLNQSKLDVSQMITTATNMATVVAVSPTAVSTSLLTTVQQNIAQGIQTSLTSLSQSLDSGTQAKVSEKNTQIKDQLAAKSANKPPQADKASFSIAADHPLTANFVASDADSDPLTYLIQKQPDHGVVTVSNPSSPTFTYQPTDHFYGEDSFLFRVNDGKVDSNVAKITITVTPPNNMPVVVTPIPAQTWNGSGSGSYQVPADSFSDPSGKGLTYSAQLVDGSILPAWLHFDPVTRTFSGNPPNGVTTLSIQVTAASNSGAVKQIFILNFNGSTNDAPTVVASITDQTWSGSGIMSFQVPANTFADADGDVMTYTATLADGSPLPTWLAFGPITHIFTGNPPAEVTNLPLKVTVSDGHGGSTSSTFSLLFSGPTNDPPSVAAPIVPQSWSGSGAWTFQVPAGTFTTDGYGLTYTATLDDGSILPSWLTFNPATSTLSHFSGRRSSCR